jgi:hypothetical protein
VHRWDNDPLSSPRRAEAVSDLILADLVSAFESFQVLRYACRHDAALWYMALNGLFGRVHFDVFADEFVWRLLVSDPSLVGGGNNRFGSLG